MADRLNSDYPLGVGRVLTRQLRQAQGGHVGLKPDLQATSRQHFCFLTAVFCLLPSAFCYAEELPDPTRPPASIAASIAAPVAASSVEAAPALAPAGLQSIIISKTRRAAIIGGETVELGGKYGDAKLIEVNEGSVVLRNAQGRQVMTLFPDVKITGKQEIIIKPQLPAAKVQSGKQKSGAVARKEKK